MSRIDELIAELCPDGVAFRELGELVRSNIGGGTPSRDVPEFWGDEIPWASVGDITSTTNFVSQTRNSITEAGLKSSSSSVVRAGDVLIATKIAPGEARVAAVDIAINQDIRGLTLTDEIDARFLVYVFQTITLKTNGSIVQSLTNKSLMKTQIPVPHLAVQQEIVRILDTMETLEAELEAELEARRKQYEHYRNSLLNFAEAPPEWNVRWTTLGEVADLNWGDTSTTKSAYVADGDRYLAYSASGPDGYLDHFDFDQSAVVLSAIGALSGKTWKATGKWSCIKNTIRFFSKDESRVTTDYLYWITSTVNFWPRRGSAQPFISKGDADKVRIPIPSLERQAETVSVLEAFDVLVNDLTSGLPAEIAARRKQYEYYRDKLLTFPELKADAA